MPAGPRKKLVINPFKTQVKMDREFSEHTWERLKAAIHKIHEKKNSELSYEELYRNGYNMVIHKHGQRLYQGLEEVIDAHLQEIAEEIRGANDDEFLPSLIRVWEEHKTSQLMIRDILMYMDRVYVGQSNLPGVYDMGLNYFLKNIVRAPDIRDRMTELVMGMIHQERCGEVVDRLQIQSITSMLNELGPDRQVYEEDFETPLLERAAEFYGGESQYVISNNSCPEYLKKVAARYQEESARVQAYMEAKTEPKLKAVLNYELIEKHMQTLVDMESSGLVCLLRDNRYEDLACMYKLFGRVPEAKGLELIRSVMNTTVREQGERIVKDPENVKDPIAYVQNILDLKDNYDNIVHRSFSSDKTFQNALNQSFEYFMNLNNKSPEYLSLFLDEKLKRGLKSHTEEEVEAVLDKTMMLFRFLQEKDVFERYYKQHLSKRLLYNRSVSDDAERSMIAKLKTECGYQFTTKLEGMFTDMKVSADTMERFHTHLSNANISLGLDMTVQILTTGFWPSQPPTKCIFPETIQRPCTVFQDFYLSQHSGRRLAWQFAKGNADLVARFGSSLQHRHEVNVSTFQMFVLLLFNNRDAMTYKEISEATEIPPNDLKRSLQSLSLTKTRLLLKKPLTKEVNDSDVFTYNVGFTSKLIKFKVSTVAAQKETEPERAETRQKVDEDRKHQIEAAIVRIMKSRKQMDHNNLIAETTAQLSSRFLPNPTLIKKRLESLIEREYLERSADDMKVYNYLA